MPNHCKHSVCCQCRAVVGSPEHADVCPDFVVSAAMSTRSGSRRIAAPWMRTLAANLAVAGGLCEAFGRGQVAWAQNARNRDRRALNLVELAAPWRPGCGRSTP